MKHPFHSHILPLFTMGAGGLGFALRLWLFSGIDEKGLLPKGHPADAALYILSALTLGVVFLATRQLNPSPVRKTTLRYGSVIACILGGLGLALTSFSGLSGGVIRLENVAKAVCILGGVTMLLKALLTALCKPIPYWLTTVLTLVLMIHTVAQCQVWGAVPQLQVFFFPLMASIFLILTAYCKATLLAGRNTAKNLAFFSQGALFFCCLSLNYAQWALYLGMAFWAAMQLYPSLSYQKEA